MLTSYIMLDDFSIRFLKDPGLYHYMSELRNRIQNWTGFTLDYYSSFQSL